MNSITQMYRFWLGSAILACATVAAAAWLGMAWPLVAAVLFGSLGVVAYVIDMFSKKDTPQAPRPRHRCRKSERIE
jgi:hypothetical protein